MFGMSMTEILVILAAVLVFLGPEKIPEAAKTIGKVLREVRKASNLLRDAVSIDDTSKPKKRNNTITETEFEPDLLDNPNPKKDVRVIEMSPRFKPNGALAEIPIAMAKSEIQHREVYLHIPYEETI